jgi:hypothetical protein
MTRFPADSPLVADAGTGAPTHARAQGGGADTLHVELAIWSGKYRIIHTLPDGRRQVWRRDIENLEDARLRTRIVADICGYEAQL